MISKFLEEHKYGKVGPGNSFISSSVKPTVGNFPGRIWLDEKSGNHFVFDGKDFSKVGYKAIYGGMKRTKKADDGSFEVVEKLDENKRVLHRSTLSNKNSDDRFTLRIIESHIGDKDYYSKRSYRLEYDDEGDLINEILI